MRKANNDFLFNYDDAFWNYMVSSTFNILDSYVMVKHRFSRVVEQIACHFIKGLFGQLVTWSYLNIHLSRWVLTKRKLQRPIDQNCY